MMIFKKKKYFICIFLVILLIGISIPTFYSLNFDQAMSESEDKFDPSDEENKAENGGEEINRTFYNGFDLFNYANSVIKNGKGYTIDNYSTIEGDYKGIKATVNMYMNYLKNEKAKFETIVFSSDIFSFANQKNYTYLDLNTKIAENTYSQKLVERNEDYSKNVFDFKESLMAVKKYPEEFIARYHRIMEIMPFNVDKKNSSEAYFRSDNKYYYFELHLKNSAIDPMFFECFTHGLGADSYECNFFTVKAVCNKKTGTFEQVTTTAGLTMPITKFGLNITLSGVLTSHIKIRQMNIPANIVIPPAFEDVRTRLEK